MKKFLVVCVAFVLPLSLVHAQEADDTGAGVGFSIIPRLDFSPEFTSGEHTLTLGNSSLYTLFEGNITDNLSFSVANHWLGFYSTDGFFDDTKALYQDSWRSDSNTWLDWATLTYEVGNFSFTAGKDVIQIGGFEMDANDWEVHPEHNSMLWNVLPAYQWGAKVGYSFDDDNEITFQWTTSPYGERPFSSGLFNYSLGWNGLLFDRLETIWSVTALQRDKGDFLPVVSLGNMFSVTEALTLGLDAFTAVGDEEHLLQKGFTVIPSFSWDASDSISFTGKVGGEYNTETKNRDLVAGVAAYWYPLQDSHDLRIHAAGGYRHDARLVTISVGVLYNLNFPRN